MNTPLNQPSTDARRRRRRHSAEFKAQAVASCMHPGISMAAVAMANGLNANLLRRWVHEAESGRCVAGLQPPVPTGSTLTSTAPGFMPMQLPCKGASSEIRIELRRAATTVTVSWPADAAAQCAAWMRELLR